jgi:hypothetical protein
MSKIPTLYIFEVQLQGAIIPVWRIIEIKRTSTLHELACVAMAAMGWRGDHLYNFNISGREFEYFTEKEDFFPEFQNENAELSTITKLADLDLNVGDSFRFTYDFGDNWEHTITLKGKSTLIDRLWGIPTCSSGSMNCPPEDFGGIDVYNQIVAMHTKTGSVDMDKDLKKWYKDFNVYDTEEVRHVGFNNRVKSILKMF